MLNTTMDNKILFIPGISNKLIKLALGNYFYDQVNFFSSMGYECEVAPTHGLYDEEQIHHILYNEIESFNPTIIIAHSKGGTDLLNSLLKKVPCDLKLKTIIMIQAPFYGSPLVNILKGSVAKKIKSSFLSHIKKKEGSDFIDHINKLDSKYRKDFMFKHKNEIKKLTQDYNVICIASTKDGRSLIPNSIFKVSLEYLNIFHRLSSDGIVPVDSALLSTSTNIIISNLDHASAVVAKKISNFKKEEFNNLLLMLCNSTYTLEHYNEYESEIAACLNRLDGKLIPKSKTSKSLT